MRLNKFSMDISPFDLLFKKNVPHILEKIFLYLDYESYKSCLMVDKTWNHFLTSESFKRIGKSTFDWWLWDLLFKHDDLVFKDVTFDQKKCLDDIYHLLQLGADMS